MGFWTDWELWEQMCFVLGCLITLVLLYGTGVHIYNSWRIKKIGAAEALKRSREEETVGTKDLDLIPFGSRALESGIEIEGIWVSRTNTPHASPIPAATPEGTRPASPACSNLSLGPVAVSREESPGAAGSIYPDNGEEEIFVEANEHSVAAGEPENVGKKDSSGSSSTAVSDGISHRSSPLEYLENENIEQTRRTESRAVSTSSRAILPHSRNQSTSHIPVDGDEDHLRALHSHRQSHVAETGQLGGSWRHQAVPRTGLE
ncbi:uncharacterized protein GIQ15_02570 [Arthroderma uncinatum]|uniref:uncharacterized protein n=1 Tax=Arthroderma uncinatum TaxID=74035 RepID=UPI00144AA2E1|nr:uncharacterized protein GIQ15_02570 [Arthroderma uncinatum]KAF3483246.1 hypothetical protein GIQ15_02570 [Arthroderma uncinatum]